MRPLQLDFSQYRARRRSLFGVAALLVSSALLAVALLQQRAIEARITQLETAASMNSVSAGPRQLSEAQQREIKVALDAQRALNLPWQPLLGALEKVQDGKVQLLALQPNPLKGEVVLNGEAANFDVLMAYLKALRAQPVFTDVVLVNQRQVAEDGRRSLAFTLAAEWNTGGQ